MASPPKLRLLPTLAVILAATGWTAARAADDPAIKAVREAMATSIGQLRIERSLSASAHLESARLAAVLPAPRRYSAVRPGPCVQRRAAWIQRQMRQLGGREHLDELD